MGKYRLIKWVAGQPSRHYYDGNNTTFVRSSDGLARDTTGNIEIFVGLRPMEVSPKPMEINFFDSFGLISIGF
jgi:hypothetical protein